MRQIGSIGTESRQGYRVYLTDEQGCSVLATPKGLSGHGGGLYMIDCKDKEDIASQYRIRKLTPLSCWRLMGFTEEDFLAAKTGSRDNAKKYMQEFEPDRHLEMMQLIESKGVQKLSNSQLYKQAGNSITTCTLYYIYKNLYEAMPYLFDGLKVGSFFSGIGAFEKALDMLQEDLRDGKKPFFVMGDE